MEAKDLELIEQHRAGNYQLDRLVKEHDELEAQIAEMEKGKGLGHNEEKKLHDLKKKKLDGREEIEKILKDLRG